MIALLAAAALALAPEQIVAKYEVAVNALKDPRVFVVTYTMEQTGARTLEQTHRIFRSGDDERDETIAVNGTRSLKPLVRVFRRRPYRYGVRALAPRPSAYRFVYAGLHRDGRHVDYVFRLTPKAAARAFAFTQVVIDGVTFLPDAVAFAGGAHGGSGNAVFAKASSWWVTSGVSASAAVRDGVAHERLAFSDWRFPRSLPASTFAAGRSRPSRKPPPPHPL